METYAPNQDDHTRDVHLLGAEKKAAQKFTYTLSQKFDKKRRQPLEQTACGRPFFCTLA